jgi:polygalacturonase
MKSGMNEDGWRVGRPTENVVVRYIRTAHGHGGAVFGSDTSGDIRNVHVHSCIYEGTDVGIRLKSTRGRGGIVEKLWFEDIVMRNLPREAIQISTAYRAWMGTTEGKAPTFRDIAFRNIRVENAQQSVNIEGLPDAPIKGVRMENISIDAAQGMNLAHLQGLELVNVSVRK